MSLATLPPLRQALAEYGLTAKKAFGQHFLLDMNLTRKIARLAGPFDGGVVIEIGPGPGGLTRALLETGAQVIAIERDARFVPLLDALAGAAEGRLTIVCADALKVDEAALVAEHAPGRPAYIVANLPYNVGTPLLIKWLTGPFRPAAMALMFQKEVADRIVARPGGGAYGRLSVIAQAVYEAKTLMDVPARAFTPPPNVDSSVVALTPRADAPPRAVLDALQNVTAAAFGQRRKMLRSSLKSFGGEALCRDVGVDPCARAEMLSVKQLLAIAEATLKSVPLTSPPQTA